MKSKIGEICVQPKLDSNKRRGMANPAASPGDVYNGKCRKQTHFSIYKKKKKKQIGKNKIISNSKLGQMLPFSLIYLPILEAQI